MAAAADIIYRSLQLISVCCRCRMMLLGATHKLVQAAIAESHATKHNAMHLTMVHIKGPNDGNNLQVYSGD